MTTAFERRRFRYSLRTMFMVVTVAAITVWLANEWKFVRDRQAWLQTERPRSLIKTETEWLGPLPESARIPIWRRMLGDTAVVRIGLIRSSQADLDQAKKLFPEAEATLLSQGTPGTGFM